MSSEFPVISIKRQQKDSEKLITLSMFGEETKRRLRVFFVFVLLNTMYLNKLILTFKSVVLQVEIVFKVVFHRPLRTYGRGLGFLAHTFLIGFR